MNGIIARTQADEILEQGMNNVMALFSFLSDNGRVEDAQKASKDREYFKKLMDQYMSGELKTDF